MNEDEVTKPLVKDIQTDTKINSSKNFTVININNHWHLILVYYF